MLTQTPHDNIIRMRINRLKANGYCVIKQEDLKDLKDTAPALYDKAFSEGRFQGKKEGREAEKADNSARISAMIRNSKSEKPKTTLEEWDGDAGLRAEFGDNFGAYEAYERNVKAGTAKIFNATTEM